MAKYEQILIDGKYHVAAITNHSLSMGEKLGLIEGSNLTDILESESNMIVIYLSLIGTGNFDLSYDDFMGKYLAEKEEVVSTNNNLISAALDVKPQNKFAKALESSTSKKVDKDQKKIKPPKLHFECVEDRYVWYCMIHGIESDIFWYYPIPDVERIYQNISAYNGWKNNPK